jgi:hypothetical protein
LTRAPLPFEHWRIDILNLYGVAFPAACRDFVIPAKAGIQKIKLDSPLSDTAQAVSSTE